MAQQNDSGFKAFLTAEAIVAYRCVRLNSTGALVYADDEEEPIGVSQEDAANATHCTVKLMTAPGTFKLTASAAITYAVTSDERGTPLYVDNDGKVSNTGTNQKFALCQGADASGDGSIIEGIAVFNKFNTA